MFFFTFRSKEKEEAKEESIAAEREHIRNKLFELQFRVEKQTVQIRELARYTRYCMDPYIFRPLDPDP